MNLLVISHKETWHDPASPCGYSTVGGFPFQMAAISTLFESTTIAVPIQTSPLPAGAIPLHGRKIRVLPLAEPAGLGWRRKLGMFPWFLCHAARLWQAVGAADAVHTPVGGDIGTIGIFLALLRRKPLFVRHCGTWGQPISTVDWLLHRLLEVIAGGRNVVLATGGAETPPSARNPHIRWIFSTSLTAAEVQSISPAVSWDGLAPLRLVTVGRLAEPKNVQSLLRALSAVLEKHPSLYLDILGDGEYRPALEQLALTLQLSNHVTFHGNVSHAGVMQTLSQSHLFVFPSYREGFPKAALEAAACGLPVIATRTSVLPQLFQSGGALLLDDPSPEALASAILQLTADPARMARMGQLARQAAQGYTLEAWGQTIGEHLQKAWGQPLTEKKHE